MSDDLPNFRQSPPNPVEYLQQFHVDLVEQQNSAALNCSIIKDLLLPPRGAKLDKVKYLDRVFVRLSQTNDPLQPVVPPNISPRTPA
jgi:hypothetical protein